MVRGSATDMRGSGYTVINEDADMYKVVRPAEVCSIETAKTLGLFDREDYYWGESKSTLRTFSSGPGARSDAQRPHQLCKESYGNGLGTKPSAKPLCTLIAPGLVPVGKACGRPEGDCPPGFKWNAETKSCDKPVRAVKQKREKHCSKQWHDWFTVPNWVMKNGYEMVDGKCYAPCPINTVPVRGADPVNGESRGTDDLKRCVDKTEYLGGKYSSEPDFCNLSWIKRLSVMMPGIGEEYMREYPRFAVNGSEAVEAAAKEGIIDIIKETMRSPENLSAHPDVTDGQCSQLVDTPERLTEAYGICENIRKNPVSAENKYVEDMTRTLKLVNANMKPDAMKADILNRFRLLKQACHYTFCDASGSRRAKIIGKEPLCFSESDIKRADLKEIDVLTSQLQAAPGDYPDQSLEVAPSTTDSKVMQRTTRKIADFLLMLAVAICVLVGLYFIGKGIFDILLGGPNVDLLAGKSTELAGKIQEAAVLQKIESDKVIAAKLKKR